MKADFAELMFGLPAIRQDALGAPLLANHDCVLDEPYTAGAHPTRGNVVILVSPITLCSFVRVLPFSPAVNIVNACLPVDLNFPRFLWTIAAYPERTLRLNRHQI